AVSVACAGPSGGRTLCEQFADKRRLVEVVDERPLAVDLDHGQPLPVALLELGDAADVHLFQLEVVLAAHLCERRPRALAEVAVVRVVDGDPTDRAPASWSPRRRARRRARRRRAASRGRATRARARSPRTPCRRSPSAWR